MNQQSEPYRYSRRRFLQTSALAAGGAIAFGCTPQSDESLIEVLHLPQTFSRRAGELTANVSGRYNRELTQLKYRVNGSQWQTFSMGNIRMPSPLFTVEMRAEDLQSGSNTITIEATPKRGDIQALALAFNYQPNPVSLPTTVDWTQSNQLDVQDGYWETLSAEGATRIRPVPGYENYDRIVNVTGAFAGGRRVETELTLRSHHDKRLYGFGVIPMWGGHVDEVDISPRRGWNFAIAWYYSAYKGIGAEFSLKQGDADANWISSYRNFKHEKGVPYRIIAECVPEVDAAGNHLRYAQRIKWFAAEETEPEEWLEVTDTEGSALPEGEYAVSVVAHRCQVEFGAVTVTELKALTV
ncbi:MAG: twin-arginine translocation signal domain-containing protein [Cyanobacteria bacterium P01_D01_bin.36]